MLVRLWNWLVGNRTGPITPKEGGIGCLGYESYAELQRSLEWTCRVERKRLASLQENDPSE